MAGLLFFVVVARSSGVLVGLKAHAPSEGQHDLQNVDHDGGLPHIHGEAREPEDQQQNKQRVVLVGFLTLSLLFPVVFSIPLLGLNALLSDTFVQVDFCVVPLDFFDAQRQLLLLDRQQFAQSFV